MAACCLALCQPASKPQPKKRFTFELFNRDTGQDCDELVDCENVQESQALGLPFEGVDLAAPLQRLHVGDEVEFRVALDRRTGQLKATEVRGSKHTSV